MADNQLLVNALASGTVIDHIPAGQAWKIVSRLKILKHKYCVTLGLNLTSARMGLKDLIKVEEKALTKEEMSQVGIFAPDATINIIENYKIVTKEKAALPKTVSGVLTCPNPQCITRFLKERSCFTVKTHREEVVLTCRFCEKEFKRDDVHDTH